MPDRKQILEVAGRPVVVTNPDKVFFPADRGHQARPRPLLPCVAGGALRGVAGRPMVLKRFVHGADGEAFFQKRAPDKRPDWTETVTCASRPAGPPRRSWSATPRSSPGW